MKKFLFTIAALALGLQMNAQTISFGPLNDEGYIEVPQGGQATVAVQYTKNSETIVKGYKFTLTFTDEFVNTVKDSKELPVFTIDPDNDYFALQRTKNNGFSALPSSEDANLKGTSGNFGTLQFQATTDAEIGSTHEVKVSNAGFSVEDESGALRTVMMEDFSFSVKIVENRITLDESVGVTSETPTGEQNVLVKRTLKAGNWNTICLPFAMTGDQVKAAFGEGVEIGDFTGYDPTYDDDDFVTSIKVNFSSVDITSGMVANHPYIIKVEDAISEFKCDNVEIAPSEEPIVHFGTTRKYKDFVGTYSVINNLGSTDEPCLFLSGNKFYYATGNTKLKAFRGYFAFYEFLKEFDPEASAKISISVDGEATSIDGIGMQRIAEGVYDLSGRKIQLDNGDLNKLQKGVYIIDGKKVTIK